MRVIGHRGRGISPRDRRPRARDFSAVAVHYDCGASVLTDFPDIDLAVAADVAAMVVCLLAAYARYPERVGRSPAAVGAICIDWVARRMAYVLRGPRRGVRGVLVIRPEAGAMLIDNVAIHPHYQRRVLGRRLMTFAEDRARAAGLRELLLFTNELMTENIEYYQRLGYTEVERRTDEGFRRVFLRKVLS
jgi:ribosomal protein S18 acetylase RimI-like enzyme